MNNTNENKEIAELLKQIRDNQNRHISLLEKSLAMQTETFLMLREQQNKAAEMAE